MTVLLSNAPFNARKLNFNTILTGTNTQIEFFDDKNLKVGIGTYADTFVVAGTHGDVTQSFFFQGDNLQTNAQGIINGGTVQGMAVAQSAVDGSNPKLVLALDGLSVPVGTFLAAVNSPSLGDDRKLIAGLLKGDDIMVLSNGRDIASGLSGHDQISGGAGRDLLRGGRGNDTLVGDKGNDRLFGQAGNDTLILDAGNDRLVGGKGSDWVQAASDTAATINLGRAGPQKTGLGKDTLVGIENALGSTGNDRLIGSKRANELDGAGGNDSLTGAGGKDVLKGGGGNDLLNGGMGGDLLTGGDGMDQFIYKSLRDSGNIWDAQDEIRDFEQGQDRINLKAMDANPSTGTDDAFRFVGDDGLSISGTGEIAYRHVVYIEDQKDYTLLLIDTDADADPEATIRLPGHIDLTEADFIL